MNSMDSDQEHELGYDHIRQVLARERPAPVTSVETRLMPDPVVSRPRRVARVEVLGTAWMGGTAASIVELRDYDLENVGAFSREAFAAWINTHAGDFQSVTDFAVYVGDSVIPWESEEHELTACDCLYPSPD